MKVMPMHSNRVAPPRPLAQSQERHPAACLAPFSHPDTWEPEFREAVNSGEMGAAYAPLGAFSGAGLGFSLGMVAQSAPWLTVGASAATAALLVGLANRGAPRVFSRVATAGLATAAVAGLGAVLPGGLGVAASMLTGAALGATATYRALS